LIGECTYADIMTVNDESLRGTVFDFSISSGTSEKPKYCINFADSYSSGIERITIHSNSV
jgi:beta-lactam-binding protein with PASTA domain